jgi:protein AaeX
MRFAELDLFGVYVAPISLMMVGAWLVTIALRRLASRSGLLQYVWHPPCSCLPYTSSFSRLGS